MKLSVLIPARNEPYLNATIKSVLENATGETEIFAILDGYETEQLPGVHYLHTPLGDGECHLRQGINRAVELCSGEFVMKLDAHCMVAKGFDTELIKAHQDKRIQVPRRKRLDAKNWKLIEDGRPPIDYEHIILDQLLTNKFIWATTWEQRTKEREGIAIDDVMHIQGSTWFLSKEWFKSCRFMDLRYTGLGQEAEEIVFETLKRGGEAKVNKNTWYAHLHKTQERDWFHIPPATLKQSYDYSFNRWIVENRTLFTDIVERFMPIPGWPDMWQKILYP
jgi:hypothetical protein